MKNKKLWASSFIPSKGGSLSLSASSESVSTNSGDFGAFLGCGVFLAFLPAFVVVFFTSLDAFLGFCSSSLGSSMVFLGSSDLDRALGCKTYPSCYIFCEV